MAAAVANTFDVGPLTWVKTEIDHSLAEARQHLDKVAADPADSKSLKFVQTHLHQVTGALSMVGLGTAARFNEEIEATVARLGEPEPSVPMLVSSSKKGMSALSNYLDSLIAGAPNRPMSLSTVYVEMAKARGAKDVSESDLFFPDLAVSLPAPENTVVVPTKEMIEHSLKQKRGSFQAGLLKLLRDRDFDGGLKLMKDAVLGIEALQVHSPSRTFWFTANGFLDAVAHSPADQRSVAVALFGKVDQQIKLLQEGNQKVPERLFRDLLLVVGKSSASTDRIRQVRALFALDDLLSKGEHGRGDSADEALKSTIRALRDLTTQQKETWLKFTSGNRSFIDAFVKQAEALIQTSAKQGNADITLVMKAIGSVGGSLRTSSLPASESLALEMATALLFVENSLENYFRLGPEFSGQARGVASRISSALTGGVLPALDPATSGLMDDISRRAQERMLIFQVGQEVQANLQHIEQALDNYFRDPLKASELPKLAPLFNQVQGALAILELNDAAALNQLIARRVSEYGSGARKGEGEDAESVAEGVSALGLYIGALQQGANNPAEALLPALIRFGLAEKPVQPKPVERAAVSQDDLQQQKQKAQELYQEWKQQPEMTATRDQLKQAVQEIKRDAEVVADKDTVQQSAQALTILETAVDPTKTGLHEALSIIAPAGPTAAPEPPSPQAVQLLDKEGSEVDAELLEIFLEEAGEVVATIREHLDIVKGAPSDKEALTTIRRGFHTLKGSGRMVGLNDLGEVAWQAEQVMNKWLKEEKPASATLQRFIEVAGDGFHGWVEELKAKGHANIDGGVIADIAEAIKSDREPVFPGAAAVEPVAVAAVEPELSAEAPAEAAAEPVPEVAPEPVPEFTPEPAPSAEVEPASTLPEDHIQVGDVVVFAPLFDIYLEEAHDHIATLERECAALEAMPTGPASHEFMRAAHTLTGSSNTTGFEVISTVAHALEMWIKAVIEFPGKLSSEQLVQTRTAVDTLARMVGDLQRRESPVPREDVAMELNQLRDHLLEGQRVGEDTMMRTGRFYGLESDQAGSPVAVADEVVAAPEIEAVPEPVAAAAAPAMPDFAALVDTPVPEAVAPPAPPAQLDVSAFDFLTGSVPEAKAEPEPEAEAAAPVELPFAVDEVLAATTEPAPEEVVAATSTPDFAFLDAPTAAPESQEEPQLVSADLDAPPSVAEFQLPAELGPESPEVAAFFDEPVEAKLPDQPAPVVVAETIAFEVPAPESFVEEPSTPPPLPEPEAQILEEPPAVPIEEPVAESVAEVVAEPETVAVPEPEAVAVSEPAVEPAPEPEAVPAPVVEPAAQPEPTAEQPAFMAGALGVAAFAGAAVSAVSAAAEPVSEPAQVAEAPIPDADVPPAAPAVEVPAAFEAGKEKRRIQDDIDADLLPIFLEEAKEIVPNVGDCLRAWKLKPTDHTPVVELARHMHTLKGSARMAGLMRLGELAHIIESQVVEMDAESAPANSRFDRVDEYWDRFTGSIDRLEAGKELLPAIEVPITELFEQQKDKTGAIAIMAAAAVAVRDDVQLEGRERQALLRVNADLIDRFVNEAGELAITRSRVDGEMTTFKKSLAELAENVTRMRTQLREIEIEAEMAMSSRIKERDEHSETFDPLEFDRFSRMQEVTRFLAESLHDVVTLQLSLQKNLDEADAALTHQGRLNRDLQQGLMGVRLVPLGNLQDRLYRIVRQTAKELNKKSNLEFRGARVELDRSVLEKITAPFEHLLRNAVSHGLEMPDVRVQSGKSEIGEITIDANQVGNEVVLTVKDDGAGLNFSRIRARALEAGLMQEGEELSEDQLAQFIFMAGFSTATEVTQISGRGVGMDVVRNEIVSLGGRIEMSSVAGKGTTFVITLPLTLAVTQAVMVRVGGAMYAIPSVMVEQVQEYKGKKYEIMLGMTEIEWKGNRYPFRSLEALLGGTPQQSVLRRAFSILAKSGQLRAAVQVDEIIGNREVVVKQIGPQLARLPGVSGATVLGNGQVVLILNPVQLVFRETAKIAVETERGMTAKETSPTVLEATPTLALQEQVAAGLPVEVEAPSAPLAPLVMVVDDSLTVRKITGRMLTREGYEFATAKDGVDGLKQLQDIQPDIILLDIEMPRMDGFEFARNVRADAKTSKIPIIMITSRTADKHRNHAKEIGVNEYMGKPYQEDQLIALIKQYVGAPASRST